MKILTFFFSLFLEKKCCACGQVGHFFCLSCQQKVPHYEPYCYVCKKYSTGFFIHKECQQSFPLTQVIVLTRYRCEPIKKALKQAKYYGRYKIYDDMLGVSSKMISKSLDGLESGILIPVPMNFFRTWKRGYNQAEKIANVFSKILGSSVDSQLIVRSRYTKHQSHLSQKQRLVNLKSAFRIQKHNYPLDTPLYLIDDVISTGATIHEIALTLQFAGFTDIRALIIASD